MTAETPDTRKHLIASYLEHWTSLRKALTYRTRSQDLAEDALQETWIRLDRMQGGAYVVHDRKAFILRVAGNIAVDMLRRESRHARRFISDETLMKAIADTAPSPETIIIDRDQLRQLALALAELPRKARMALLMSRSEGLTHAEIATRMQMSTSMVAKYLAQALRHCRDHFRRIDGTEEI
ncbi:MAG: RNA polymerase sigma factor [Candidatus Devosia phytovorans]|uniref:RNA polymerase sigma factor n=1 Tax=Candidatus Devosia phytovorans TaxID=3121372 RepID=A0AAJ5VX56_9HYPH|nr:RNA polymerase sigma factor [Devosia sp.]WEK06027.1 MAG: RNA polymerase sigma factor [Devosia sp.]